MAAGPFAATSGAGNPARRAGRTTFILPVQIPGLEVLSLSGTRVGDRGLGRMSGLIHLSLDETQVTDAGLRDLYRLKNLRRISLWKTRVTDRGVANLQKALPDLEINR